jgi:nucleoid-associated protein YgaU
MVGLGLTATAALATPLPRTVAASPPGPVATMQVADPAPLGTATLRATAPLPDSERGTASLTVVEPGADDLAAVDAAPATDRAGPDGLDPARSDDPGAVIDHAGPTHRVVPGDHLWSIAERTVEAHTGRTDEAAVERYWRSLVAANPQLAHPDLVFPGEVLALPPLDAPG